MESLRKRNYRRNQKPHYVKSKQYCKEQLLANNVETEDEV